MNAGDGWSWGKTDEPAETTDEEGDRAGSEGDCDGEDEDEEAGGVHRDKLVVREWEGEWERE